MAETTTTTVRPATQVSGAAQSTDAPRVPMPSTMSTSPAASAPSTVDEPVKHPSWPIATHVVSRVREHLAMLDPKVGRDEVLKAIDALEGLSAHEKAKLSRQIVEMPQKEPTMAQMRDALST